MTTKEIKEKLEYFRGELREGTISYSELYELQQLKDQIEDGDVELLEAAGVPEFPIELSEIQKEIIKKKCPHCEVGDLHEVEGESENYLYCNQCDCSVDSDGGYTY